MREVLELPEIKDVEIVDGKVRVETKDNVFVDVMKYRCEYFPPCGRWM